MEKVEKKRIDWIDTLRGIAMFFLGYQYIIIVILKHYYPVLGSSNAYMFINTLITFALLFIISIPVYKFFPCLVGKFKFLSKI